MGRVPTVPDHAQPPKERGVIGDAEHVALHPRREGATVTRDLIPCEVEGVIARVIPLGVGGIGTARHDARGGDHPRGENERIHVGLQCLDLFLHRDEQLARRQRRLFRRPDDAADEHVAAGIDLLRVQDRDIGSERRNECKRGVRERAGQCLHGRTLNACEIGRGIAAHEPTRQAARARLVGHRHLGVCEFCELERLRPAALDRIAQAMERADAGISTPGEGQPRRATHADQLVVYQVWRHADQVQAAALLADDLVPGGKGNQVSEALERNARAILDVGSNRLAQ